MSPAEYSNSYKGSTMATVEARLSAVETAIKATNGYLWNLAVGEGIEEQNEQIAEQAQDATTATLAERLSQIETELAQLTAALLDLSNKLESLPTVPAAVPPDVIRSVVQLNGVYTRPTGGYVPPLEIFTGETPPNPANNPGGAPVFYDLYVGDAAS
jgi:hypothetical protein